MAAPRRRPPTLGTVGIETFEIRRHTSGAGDVIDLTPEIAHRLAETGFTSGAALVFVIGATAAVSTLEFEKGLAKDAGALWRRLVPDADGYEHFNAEGGKNAASHLRAALQGASVTVPFVKSKLALGAWQQIVLIEFDERPRDRRVVLQFQGLR